MKKLLLILCVAALFAACGDDDDKGKLSPDAAVLIKPDLDAFKTVATRADASQHLSALEIVKQTWIMSFQNPTVHPGAGALTRGFAPEQRDFSIPALKMWGVDIINQDGEFALEFIAGEDIILENKQGDTIAYIANSTLKDAHVKIKAAYDAENYTEVYKLFDEAFTFKPTTGEEWRALKEKDMQ